MKIVSDIAKIASPVFVRGALVYLLGGVVNALLGLAVLPIFTRILTPNDYGLVATSAVLVQVFTITLGLNGWGLIARSHFDSDLDAQRKLLSTNIVFAVALSILIIAACVAFGELAETVTKFPGSWMPIIVIVTLFGVIRTNYLCLVQAENKSIRYVLVQTVSSILDLGLGIVFVLWIRNNWEGRMLASAISGFIVASFSLHALIVRMSLLRPIFETKSLLLILNFGLPLVPHFIGGWVMTMAPRLYLNNMATVADTGIFSVAFNFASPIALVVGAANQAYWPLLFGKLSTPSFDRLRLSRALLLGAAALPVCAGVYTICIKWLLPLVVGPRFYQAADYVLWFAMAFAMQGVYFIFGNFVNYSKRTSLIAWRADFLGGSVTMVACPFLIHLNGAIGAAQAMLVGFTVSCIGCFAASRIAFPMPWKEAFFSLFRRDRLAIVRTEGSAVPRKDADS